MKLPKRPSFIKISNELITGIEILKLLQCGYNNKKLIRQRKNTHKLV